MDQQGLARALDHQAIVRIWQATVVVEMGNRFALQNRRQTRMLLDLEASAQCVADQAIYKQAADDQRTQAINAEADAIKKSFIPTVLGTAAGAVATSTDGRKWVKDLFKSTPATDTTTKKPFTGSFS